MVNKILIFSDYAWPYCYIGKGIVDELKKEYEMGKYILLDRYTTSSLIYQ